MRIHDGVAAPRFCSPTSPFTVHGAVTREGTMPSAVRMNVRQAVVACNSDSLFFKTDGTFWKSFLPSALLTQPEQGNRQRNVSLPCNPSFFSRSDVARLTFVPRTCIFKCSAEIALLNSTITQLQTHHRRPSLGAECAFESTFHAAV